MFSIAGWIGFWLSIILFVAAILAPGMYVIQGELAGCGVISLLVSIVMFFAHLTTKPL